MKQKSLYIAIVLALHCAVAVADNSIDSTQIDEVTVNGDGNNISGLTPCATPSNCKSPLGNSSVSGNNNTITSLTNYIITGSNNDLSFSYDPSQFWNDYANSFNVYGNNNTGTGLFDLNLVGSDNKVLGQNLAVMGYSNNVSGSALQVIGSYNELDMVGM